MVGVSKVGPAFKACGVWKCAVCVYLCWGELTRQAHAVGWWAPEWGSRLELTFQLLAGKSCPRRPCRRGFDKVLHATAETEGQMETALLLGDVT